MRHLQYRLVAAGALALASSISAQAADLPRRMPLPPAPTAAPAPYFMPAFSWTGFYVGGNVGYGWSKGDGDFELAVAGVGPIEGEGNGFNGGIQAGYNWQAGAWVFGLEADFQGSTGKGDVTGSPGAATLVAESDTPWFGTLRGRIGYASDRWMTYVTGGAVYGESELSGTVTGPGGGGAFSSSEQFWTWTVGGGVEWCMWDRWSAKLEYLYIGTPGDVPMPPDTQSFTGDITTHLVRVGLNYRF